MGGLLGQLEGGRRANQRHRHSGVLPDEGAVSQERQVPRKPRFFGECCAAARKRGLHVIARMSPDLNWEDAVQAHPEWFQRDAQGNVVHHSEDPRLFRTCMFTTYMTDYMTAIMKEI